MMMSGLMENIIIENRHRAAIAAKKFDRILEPSEISLYAPQPYRTFPGRPSKRSQHVQVDFVAQFKSSVAHRFFQKQVYSVIHTNLKKRKAHVGSLIREYKQRKVIWLQKNKRLVEAEQRQQAAERASALTRKR
jgi:hypothetical protein